MQRKIFTPEELQIVERATSVSEELVSDHFKISESQWLRNRFDIRTSATTPDHPSPEPPHIAFAEVRRYEAVPSPPGSRREFDLYLICLRDHTIIGEVTQNPDLTLYPFLLYILVHELVHILRFGTFRQRFTLEASQRKGEEEVVHELTRRILSDSRIEGVEKIISQTP